MRRIALTVLLAGALALTGSEVATASTHGTGSDQFPTVISLPDGFRPEGISAGRGTSFYVGSLVDGAIYRGDVRTGRGAVLIPGQQGRIAAGTEVDKRNRLFVAGASSGAGRVYDAKTGAELASYQFAAPDTFFVNDVVVTRDAAYFTDSLNPVLYVVPLGHGGRLGTPRTLPFSGELQYQPGFNANGIEASPDGRTLLVIQSNTGKLFAVNAKTGATREVDLHGETLLNGDGLLRRGSTLYVVRNQNNLIAVVRLDRSYRSGTLTRTITSPNFDVPTTVAGFGPFLYAVNARFNPPPPPDTTYTVVRVSAR